MSYNFFFKSLLASQWKKIYLVTHGFFLQRSFSSFSLAACFCCIIDGNHGIDVHVLISKFNEWCEFPTYHCLKSASSIWFLFSRSNLCLGCFDFRAFFIQTNSKGKETFMQTKCFEPLQKLRSRVWIQLNMFKPPPLPRSNLLLIVQRRFFCCGSSQSFLCISMVC